MGDIYRPIEPSAAIGRRHPSVSRAQARRDFPAAPPTAHDPEAHLGGFMALRSRDVKPKQDRYQCVHELIDPHQR